MYTDLKEIHIGREIKKILDEKGIGYSTVGQWLNVDRSSVYHMLSKKSIDIDRLIILSQHLNYDFIKEIYQKPTDEQSRQSDTIYLSPHEHRHLHALGITQIRISVDHTPDIQNDANQPIM